MSLASDYRAITDDISMEVTGPRTLVCASHSHRRGRCISAPDIQADIRPPGSSRTEKEERRQEELTIRIRCLEGPWQLGGMARSGSVVRGPIVAVTRGWRCWQGRLFTSVRPLFFSS